ncbi:MAG: hypothetical protein ACSHXY_02440 [Alphaproteobacteria bacterium]
MNALEKICDILSLQRKNLEREIAALDSQTSLLDVQLVEIEAEKNRMTEAIFSGGISDNAIQDSIVLEVWKGKMAHTVLSLEKRKSDILLARAPKLEALTVLIVREDTLRKKRRAEIKANDELRDETQTAERLETWVNTHIL